ncbi:putative RNA methyltransferase YfjO [Marinithermofilum abyssi]|uniref:Putative RNA methyltransferase YfjO n=1 Tax=Marinithermofilum abyssi TaxID=1571185 RepID=A0A8J2YD06_9BACL|nr:23S rRNA (uracil(1939)-C(5))-methyltransferase RlmD [Marinithermofilum abyssi]GGE20388.1 putative RNA methyltransferase YfjO [Marinithermofilum abyssi]
MSRNQLRKGQVIELPIRRIGINGEGVGVYQKKVVFVDGAIPGEYVAAKLTEVQKNYARGKIFRIKKRSSHRLQPPCPVYRSCGGCQMQHIDYPMQLRLKRELVEEAFARYTGLTQLPIEETVGMDRPWSYRNKAQLPLKQGKQGVWMGMYKPGSHQLVDVGECDIQHPETNRLLEEARQVMEELGIPVYDERKGTGILRHLAARIGFATGEAQLVLVSRSNRLPREEELIHRLRERLPQLKSVVLNINPRKTSRVLGEKSRVLWGQRKIRERLGHLTFLLSGPAFFQLNPVQTVKLYDEVKRSAGLSGKETVVDAYCGVGTIGLWLADQADRVIGMDTIPEAVEDAKENAEINGIDHAEYHLGEAERLLPRWVREGLQPDVVVVDPPRTGLGQELIQALIEVQVPRIVYVSCNPSTLAKDCRLLLKQGYQVKRVVPFDMFPQTAHVESVTLLER